MNMPTIIEKGNERFTKLLHFVITTHVFPSIMVNSP